MEMRHPHADERVIPEIAAVFQAVDALRHRLSDPAENVSFEPAVIPEPIETPRRDGEACRCRYEAIFFGAFMLRREDRPVALGQQWSTLELCRYLIAQRGRLVPRDELLEVLWPDAPDSPNGLHRLHVAVSTLRRLAGPEPTATPRDFVRLQGDCYSVPTDAVETDFARFDLSYDQAQRRLARGDRAEAASGFRAAIALYRGEFLADHPYADWTHLFRDHFRERRLAALAALCECAERDRDHRTAIELATAILAVDNLRETAHRQLMRARYACGERGLAIRQYQTCAALLSAELGVAPSLPTRRLHEAIRDDHELPPEPTPVP